MIFTDTVSESSYFELLGDGKCGLFLNLKVDGKIIFSGYWKILVLGLEVLVLNILKMGNLVFFWASLCSIVDEKVIFTWSFCAFHDISGLGKHGFLYSGVARITKKDWPYFIEKQLEVFEKGNFEL